MDKKLVYFITDEEELDDLSHEYMQECFIDIKQWIKDNSDDFEVKIVKKNEVKDGN